MAEALSRLELGVPTVPVVANVTAEAVRDPATIQTLLVQQVTGMVRWRETVLYFKEQGVTEIVELGAGKVLAGLIRRIDKEITVRSIGTPADIEAFHAVL
jgi:[acyl-carrier-protein] S-malonyltransferase